MPLSAEGQFDFAYTLDNLVVLRSAANGRYLRNGVVQRPPLRFDGAQPQDFDLVYVARDWFALVSHRVGGSAVGVGGGAIAVGDDDDDIAVSCNGAAGDARCAFQFVIV